MKTSHSFSRRPLIVTATIVAAACLLPAGGAIANDLSTPTSAEALIATPESTQLTATPWETTSAVNQDGTPVALGDPNVANFVGYAYYNPNGTFTMYNLDDTPKMQGDWTVDNTDGNLTRTLVAKDAEGNILFTRVVPITVLNANEFTYRIYPDATNTAVYYDIIHTPTTHTEPITVPGENTDGNEESNGNNTGTDANEPSVNEQENVSPKDATGTAGDLAVTGTNDPGLLWGGLASLLGGAALITRRLFRMTNSID